MTYASIPRSSIEPRLHGAIDTELKNLKLLTRRLQSSLTVLPTELQLLHRLYYKNKNQHRGAVFWRNVTEVRRFLERIERLNLQDSLSDLRSRFYDTTQNVKSTKGPWTQCPDIKYLSMYFGRCQKALQLVEKTAERCVAAYSSFHRSFQSAAFLQILLMFVAISSRTRALAIEIREIMVLVCSSVGRLSSTMVARVDNEAKEAVPDVSAELVHAIEWQASNSAPSHAGTSQYRASVQQTEVEGTSSDIGSKRSTVDVVIEKIAGNPVADKLGKDPAPVKEKSGSNTSKKRKGTIVRNEIDDIFGF